MPSHESNTRPMTQSSLHITNYTALTICTFEGFLFYIFTITGLNREHIITDLIHLILCFYIKQVLHWHNLNKI